MNKQSIVDRQDYTKPNPFIGACHIPDPLNKDFCMICGNKITLEQKEE